MRASRIFMAMLALVVVADSDADAQGAGVTRQMMIHSSEYGRDRRVWVYTPPGYDARRKDPYALFIGFDGNEAVDPRMMNMPGMLDSLLEVKSAPAFVA